MIHTIFLQNKIGRLLCMAILLVTITGCTSEASSEQVGVTHKGSDEKIVIGVAWPFETNNDLFAEGVELAVNDINDDGGLLGKTVEVVKRDDEASVTKGLEIAQEFAENEEMSAVIGHRNSYISIPASSIYERANLLMLSPASTSPELVNEDHQLIFRNIFNDEMLAERLTTYMNDEGFKNIVIIYDDDDYGKGLANAFETHANQLGMDVVDRLSSYTGIPHLEQLKYAWELMDYDAIFVSKGNPEGAEFIKDIRKAKINVPIFGGNALDSPDLWDLSEGFADGAVIGSIFNLSSSREEVREFMSHYTDEYHSTPSQYSAQGYDAVNILREAIEQADSTNPVDIADALREMGGYVGVAGEHEFNALGDDVGDIIVLKHMQNGRIQYIDLAEE